MGGDGVRDEQARWGMERDSRYMLVGKPVC